MEEKNDLETRHALGAFQGDLPLQIRNGREGSTLQFECSIEGSHEDYNGRLGLVGSLSDLEARMSIEPIAHMPVYKRIELRPVRVREPPEPVNARASGSVAPKQTAFGQSPGRPRKAVISPRDGAEMPVSREDRLCAAGAHGQVARDARDHASQVGASEGRGSLIPPSASGVFSSLRN